MRHVEPLIKELGLENRIFILKRLREGGKSVAGLRKELKNAGINKPFSTVVRYMQSLQNMHLVCELDEAHHLTLKGRIVLNWLDGLEHGLTGFEKVEETLSKHPINYLPNELLTEIHVIATAEVINDPFNVMWDTVKAVENAKKKVMVVNKDIINREFGELAVKRCIKGLKLLSVVDSSTVKERIDMLYDIIKECNIKGKELETLKKNFVVKSLDNVSLNLIIADKKGAGISLPNPKSKNSLTPAFKSINRDFVNWVEKIFALHRGRGKDVKW